MKITIFPSKLSKVFKFADFYYKAIPGSYMESIIETEYDVEWKRLTQAVKLIGDDIVVADLQPMDVGGILRSEEITDSLLKGRKRDGEIDISRSGVYDGLSSFVYEVLEGVDDRIEPHRFYLDRDYRSTTIKSYLPLSEGTNYAGLIELADRMIYTVNQAFGAEDPFFDQGSIFPTAVTPGLFLSPDPVLNTAYLKAQTTISPDNILAILGISGINVVFPSVFCEEEDDLEVLKQKYGEERQNYLDELSLLIRDCHEGIRAGDYVDAWEFANIVTDRKIKVHVRRFEQAVRKGDKSFLKRVKVGFAEGIPTIGEALLNPSKSTLAAVGAEVLKVFCSSIMEKSALKSAQEKYPLASYAYYLREHAEK